MLKRLVVACLGAVVFVGGGPFLGGTVPASASPTGKRAKASVKAAGGNVTGRLRTAVFDKKVESGKKVKTPAAPKLPKLPTIGFTIDPTTPRDADLCLRNTDNCVYIDWPDAKKPTKEQKAALEAQLRQVVTQLKLPDPTPRFGPDPSVNEWKMLAVGFPVWLWTDSPKTVTSTATRDGLTFTLKATWASTTFRMGDGHTKTCSRTSVYPAHIDKPGSPSPTCGYIYDAASPKGHPYTVSAETHWRIDWSTGGQSGSFDHSYTGGRTLEIGELASMIKR